MNISELIAKLSQIMVEEGDLPIYYDMTEYADQPEDTPLEGWVSVREEVKAVSVYDKQRVFPEPKRVVIE